ncbi:MAG: DeoR/GlpR transcriptional regulator [Actinobacteria bacterium]|nr:DeoR/GlpR transcriptional regulator [Actinomycetota bacterium]
MKIPEKRRIEIKELVQKEKSVSVEKIAEVFGISVITVRRDLEKLQEQGYITKVHGGAIIKSSFTYEPVFEIQKELYRDEKSRIASEAAKRINDGDSIIIESGSTCLAMVKFLTEKKNLRISTAGVSVANELLKLVQVNKDFEVSACGGIIREGSSTYVGPHAVSYFKNLNVDISFIGAVAISLTKGLSTATQFDAEIVKAVTDCAKKVIVLTDSSKFHKESYINFLPFENITEIITDSNIEPKTADSFTRLGVKLTIV